MSPVAYIGFGSNLGNRERKFAEALRALGEIPATVVTAHSGLFETEPVDLSDDGPMFLNAAIAVDTKLSAKDLLNHMRQIELKLGKSPLHRSDMSRTIDLDLLLYGSELLSEGEVEVPHPRMHLRAFVLAPLAEIAASAVHPTLNRTVGELVRELPYEELVKVRPVQNPCECSKRQEPDPKLSSRKMAVQLSCWND
ncbi:MAG: 2-amino-4-hydroxy-6-hydroxymethyldihydropteridine diphosphokinase [Thermodesulfobacteriota bacterium]